MSAPMDSDFIILGSAKSNKSQRAGNLRRKLTLKKQRRDYSLLKTFFSHNHFLVLLLYPENNGVCHFSLSCLHALK